MCALGFREFLLSSVRRREAEQSKQRDVLWFCVNTASLGGGVKRRQQAAHFAASYRMVLDVMFSVRKLCLDQIHRFEQ